MYTLIDDEIFEILFDIVLLAIGYFNEKRWIKVTMLIFIILNLSGSQIKYNALYFMIPIIALLCENEYDILDIISIVILSFSILLNPFELSFVTKCENLLWFIELFYLIIIVTIISLVSLIIRIVKLKKQNNLKSILYLC